MPSPLSRSRAVWNLRAEQVMDQVFNKAEPSLRSPTTAALTAVPHQQDQQAPPPRSPARQSLLIVAGLLAVLGTGSSLWLARNWQHSLNALNRERDLQLIERLRRIPIASTDPAESTVQADRSAAATPSPESLELKPLTIPIAGPLPIAEPTLNHESNEGAAMPAEPLLVGVVHAGGGQGSAIFQLDQLSLSAAPGEAIGNSGWRLKSVQANGAVIEHNGMQRTLSVGGAF